MKIFSMSVYGENPRYITGAFRQIELCQKFFPNWQIRIYTDNFDTFSSVTDQVTLAHGDPNVFGMFWRFLPMFESPDNIVIVRDSDSRVTMREQLAVNEWISSNQAFHTMRDHDAHYEWPIIGTMFGYKGQLSDSLYNSMINHQGNHYYTADQVWLRDCVWPAVKDHSMIHCMNSTTWFSHTRKLLKTPCSFCGNGYYENDMPIYPPSLAPGWQITDADKFDEGVMNKDRFF